MRAVVAALMFAWALLTHAAVTVTDDRGVAVTLPAPPQRIVTLLPSLTETVCELGACARIVGTDRYSNYPASVIKLPKTGGLDDANVELIAALKPDVVLLAMSSRVTDRLEALGLKVMALEPKTYADVQRVMGKVAQVLGQEAAGDRLWRELEAKVSVAAQTVPASMRGVSVYYEIDSSPYAAGESSFIGQLLSNVGLVNIVPTKLGPFPKLNPEYVVRADPEVIMLSAKNAPSMPARPGWDRIRAVKNQRICAFTPAQGDVLSRPGPRMGEAAQIMAACLRDLAAVARAGAKP
ncbi:MAG: helical backbone metal receptor [Aquabacterium sp.]